jgi:CysZ protein
LLKDIILAIQAYGQAHRFIREHKLWKWIIVPGIIYMVLFCVSMYFFGKSASDVVQFLMTHSGLHAFAEKMHSRTIGFFITVGGIILWIVLMLLYFSLFKYVWLILGSPIFAYLSEKTESIIEGKDFPFSFSQLLIDVARGIRIALRNTIRQTGYLLLLLLLSFIPFAGWVTPVFVLLIESYYYGFSMLDYSCERHKMSVSESIYFIGTHRGLAIGNGIMFYLMHWVPVVGWIFAPAYAVIAATLSMYPNRNIKASEQSSNSNIQFE